MFLFAIHRLTTAMHIVAFGKICCTNRKTLVTGGGQAGQQVAKRSQQVPKPVQRLLAPRLHAFNERQAFGIQRYPEDAKKILNYSTQVDDAWLVLPARCVGWGQTVIQCLRRNLPQLLRASKIYMQSDKRRADLRFRFKQKLPLPVRSRIKFSSCTKQQVILL